MRNINGITVRLGGRIILDRATAALPPGSRVGLIGRNGAGKSTLVPVIAGLLEPDDGAAEMPRGARQIGRAHACTPVTNEPLVCRLWLEEKNNTKLIVRHYNNI